MMMTRRHVLTRGKRAVRAVQGWSALLALAACGCGRAPTLDVTVDVRGTAAGELGVAVQVRGAHGDSVSFRGYAPASLLSLDRVAAADAAGHALPVWAGVESVGSERGTRAVPRVTVRGPIPDRFTLRYVVRPGTKEGDAHLGFAGTRFGYAGPRFAFVTGRNLFLLPTGAASIRSARVHFLLPPGWQVETPWSSHRDGWRTEMGRHFAAEHLISASIGMGRFLERTVAIPRSGGRGGGTLTMAFEGGIPSGERDRAAEAMERVARYVDGLFVLAGSYRVVVVPEAPDGDALEGEGWATGQGGTFAPITPARLERFARRLIETRTTHAPFRTEVADPADYWLVEGITRLYAWRALARTGWADEQELAEDYARAYVEALQVPGAEFDLEKAYASDQDHTAPLEVTAPTTLLCLDRQLRSATGGPEDAGPESAPAGLDAVVRRMFRDLRPARFWRSLPPEKMAAAEAFRRRFVQGHDVLPVETLAPIEPLGAGPRPAAGVRTRRVTLVLTGNTFGYLENCGCKVNQSGGLARRATAIAALRRREPGLVLIDAGNAFTLVDSRHHWDALAHREQQVYLGLMAGMGYDAAALGPAELAFGADTFLAVARPARLPYVAANVDGLDTTWVHPWRLVRGHGVRIAVIGLTEPQRGWSGAGTLRPAAAAVGFNPVLDVLRANLAEMRRAADLVVAIGRLRPATVRRLASRCPGLDLIVSTDRNAVSLTTHEGLPLLSSEDEPGFAGRTAVLYTTLDSYGLEVARLDLDREGHVISAPVESVWLDARVADDPAVRATLDRFYQGSGRVAAGEAEVTPLFPDDAAWLGERFAGAARCGSCHAAEYRQWQSTPHASAFKTLLDVHRHYQPRCVVCHVVGLGTAHGYRIEGGDQTLAGVQCEVCHGPGAAHASHPTAANVRQAVPERVCVTCHDADHSDRFVYQDKLPLVVHPVAGR